MSILAQIPSFQALELKADHLDVKTIEGETKLRDFLAQMFSYYPAWIKFLYGIRWIFVRFLGMKQENLSQTPKLKGEDIPFERGQWATFFQVEDAEEDLHWIASASDKHLSAYIVVAVEKLDKQQRRFYVATIVHYRNWAGPIYFNVIRPFHHLVVQEMMKAGIQVSS